METPVVPGLVLSRRINDARAGQWLGPSDGPPTAAPARTLLDEVYLARRLSDGVDVAVKVYTRPRLAPREQLRFEQEIAALKALLGCPHIFPPLDAGVVGGQAYVVTPFCPSGSLQDHLVTVGRFTPIEVRRIGTKLADALARIHQLGLVHRNVKPTNVLIDTEGRPQLADFGLVSLTLSDGQRPEAPAPDFDATVRYSGALDFGGPLDYGGARGFNRARAFRAPEAYLPELMTASADIYSLGATLYTLLAGWTPGTDDPLAVVVDGDSVADLPKVPWALMSVLRRAIAMDPRDRFADATAFANALTAAG